MAKYINIVSEVIKQYRNMSTKNARLRRISAKRQA